LILLYVQIGEDVRDRFRRARTFEVPLCASESTKKFGVGEESQGNLFESVSLSFSVCGKILAVEVSESKSAGFRASSSCPI